MTEIETSKSLTPLQDGHYRAIGTWYEYIIIEGPKVVVRDTSGCTYDVKIEIGQFGEADPAIVEATGQNLYNINMTLNFGMDVNEYGVVSEDGAKIAIKGYGGVTLHNWITQEEVDALEADGDPMDAPPVPYKIQPNNLGKFLWITGAAGLGKSTSAQIMSRTAGYVYYEADCFGASKNPYIPSDVPDPSMAQFNQRKLIGEGLKDRREAMQRVDGAYRQLFGGGDYDKEGFDQFFGLLCEDIKKERKRIGGDWAIAAVTLKRESRDFIRSCLGPDLVFVVLNMDEEEVKKRVLKRHKGDEGALDMLMAINKVCDPAGKDEENALNIKITDDMTREDVVNKILEMVQ